MLRMKEWCGRDVPQPLQRKDTSCTPAMLSPLVLLGGNGCGQELMLGSAEGEEQKHNPVVFIASLYGNVPSSSAGSSQGCSCPSLLRVPALLGAQRFYSVICGA